MTTSQKQQKKEKAQTTEIAEQGMKGNRREEKNTIAVSSTREKNVLTLRSVKGMSHVAVALMIWVIPCERFNH